MTVLHTTSILLLAWGGLAVLFAAAWVVQKRREDASIVDVVWSFAFAPTAIFYAIALERRDAASWVVVVLVCTWAVRLAWHLLAHRVLGHVKEDGRYAAIRAAKGASAHGWFFGFFQAQALSVVVLSLSCLGVLLDPPGTALPLAFGGACFVASILGEAVADRQLERFRSDSSHRGKVCRVGLWRYSRHPNYFFEWLHWLAYPILASGGSFSYDWMTWIAPPVMLLLVLKVTGIPPTETQALRSRGDAYREYQRTTSPFIPWFPRTSA